MKKTVLLFCLAMISPFIAKAVVSKPSCTLYMIGTIDETTWGPQNGVLMENESGDIYTAQVRVNNSGDGYGYFGFTKSLGTNSDDWTTLNNNRYGSESNGCLLTSGEPSNISMNNYSENTWKIEAGYYEVEVDFSNSSQYTVTLTECVDEDGEDGSGFSSEEYIDYSSRKTGVEATGTLPVMHINVYCTDENNKNFLVDSNGNLMLDDHIIGYNLLDREYRKGQYWLEIPDGCMMSRDFAIGSEEMPLSLQIKARGNYTRTGYSKKPFKLKLNDKLNLLGINRKGAVSKHWALLAHADDPYGYLRNFTGFLIGSRIGLMWTPNQYPIEVYINGDYRGIYFLTESIRVEEGRMEITELGESVSDNGLISGGYLVELDNYYDTSEGSSQISMTEKYCVTGHATDRGVNVTPDTPEVYSEIQQKFVREQFSAMNDCMESVNTGNELWKYMDLDDAARYYIIKEIMSDTEAYHGSTFLYRDFGENNKWHFGPLWDFGQAFNGSTTKYFYDCDSYGNTWIPSMSTNSKFKEKVKETWKWFMQNCYGDVLSEIDSYCTLISSAAARDHQRWGGVAKPKKVYLKDYGQDNDPRDVIDNTNILVAKSNALSKLNGKLDWLKGQWGDYSSGTFGEPARDTSSCIPLPDYAKQDYVTEETNFEDGQYIFVYDHGGWARNGETVWVAIHTKKTSTNRNTALKAQMKMYYDKNLMVTVDGINYQGVYYYKVPDSYVNGYAFVIVDAVRCFPDYTKSTTTYGSPLQSKSKMLFTTDYDPDEESCNTPTAFNEVQGADVKKAALVSSLTLPTLYFYDNDKLSDPNKPELNVRYHLDPMGAKDTEGNLYRKVGTYAEPLEASFSLSDLDFHTASKRSYKVSLNDPASLLGMNSADNFTLVTCEDADGKNHLLENYIGNLLSREIGMTWTPEIHPVELVVNNEYKGVFLLCETIRPGKNRVDIPKYVPDQEISWIVKLDNNADADKRHYSWSDNPSSEITSHHIISINPDIDDFKTIPTRYDALKKNLKSEIETLQNVLAEAETDVFSLTWAEHIDHIEAAKYFIINEILDNPSAFSNDFYMWKPFGNKWNFGPVWNFNNAFSSSDNKSDLAINGNAYDGAFITKLYKNKNFFVTVIKQFLSFKRNLDLTDLNDHITAFSDLVKYAYAHERKENHVSHINNASLFRAKATIEDDVDSDGADGPLSDAPAADSDMADVDPNILEFEANANLFKNIILENLEMLESNDGAAWNEGSTTVINPILNELDLDAPVEYFDITGRRIDNPHPGNFYIVRQGNRVTRGIMR